LISRPGASAGQRTLTIRVRERALETSDGARYRLTDRLFFLYLLLGWQRRAPGAPDDGYVGCDLIRRLPHWEKNTLASVGKQVRRHILQMERRGLNLIEYRERIKGPFRLRVHPSAIAFDATPGEIRRLLDMPLARGPGRREDALALHRFVQEMCEGNAAFDAGTLDDARDAYQRALRAAVTPEQKVTALQKAGRVLERQARYDRARTLYRRALQLQHRHAELDDSTTARTHLLLGWLEYRCGRYARARDHYYRALDMARGKRDDWLLGQLHNALGLLQKRADEYEEALALFRTALDYWSRADYAYGIGAVYANIGTTHVRWGNHLRDHGIPGLARSHYLQAVEWLERCLQFSTSARLGEDTSEAQGVLAEAHRELGNLDQAWLMARAAQEAAQRAGNELDLASALLILGKLNASAGQVAEARALLADARRRFERLGDAGRAGEVARRLESLGDTRHRAPEGPLRSPVVLRSLAAPAVLAPPP